MRVKRNLEVGEVIIECIINGSGQTVILLPRLGGDADQIEELAQALADAGFCTVGVNPIRSGKWKSDFPGCLRTRFAALAGEFFGPMAWGISLVCRA